MTEPERSSLALRAVDEWVAVGLLDEAAAARIREYEAARAPAVPAAPVTTAAGPPVRQSTVIEALSYVGGAVIAAGLMMVTFGYWESLPTAWQVAIPLAATVVLIVAGAVVPQRLGPIATRLRGALWMVSVATMAGLLIVIAIQREWDDLTAPRFVAAGTFAYAAVLWAVHRTTVGQLAAFVAAEMVALAVISGENGIDGAAAGVVIAAVALAWGVAAATGSLPGTGRYLPPAGGAVSDSAAAERRAGLRMAAVGAGVAAIVLAASGAATWTGVLPVLAVVVAAVALSDVAMVIIGAVAALIAVPMVADYYLRSTLAVALVLLITGGLLVAVAVGMVRRRGKASSISAP